ncbi:MAG: hypothetical protein JJU28_06735 [Cyclobacteriaceae bacterium]|nr:hypothetical protein [Cyclobacteriaceae bacterium]
MAGLNVVFYNNVKSQNHDDLLFEKKARVLIHHIADHYQPPSPSIGDPEKYYWPYAMARFEKYGLEDSLANFWISRFSENAPFHFTLVGMSRILHRYTEAQSVKINKFKILEKAFERKDANNASTSEGTENHINMDRTSGYLHAQSALSHADRYPEAEKRFREMDQWLRRWSHDLFQNGNGEWHSGIYQVYNLMGWLNIYDFAKNDAIKAMAKAVLDYYAAELALYYSFGGQGGPEMRGTAIPRSGIEATTYLTWLWFSQSEQPPVPFRGAGYIQCLHAATSTYRPVASIVKLALGKSSGTQYLLSRPDYHMLRPSFVRKHFYMGDNFSMGSARSNYGGWTGASYQMVNWKLLIKGQGADSLPMVIGGNGRFYENFGGNATTPFTQIVQHDNTLLQMTRTPLGAQTMADTIKALCLNWDSLWQRDFTLRFPDSKKHHGVVNFAANQKVLAENSSYIILPKTMPVSQRSGHLLLHGNNAWICVSPFGDVHSLRILDKLEQYPTYQAVVISAEPDQVCGFVLEVFDSKDFKNQKSVEKYLKRKSPITPENAADQSFIEVKNRQNIRLRAVYQATGTFEEPMFDWGFGPTTQASYISDQPWQQPQWPYGNGYGRMPELYVNGVPQGNRAIIPLFEGPGILMKNGVLEIQNEGGNYRIDYSGEVPVFHQ